MRQQFAPDWPRREADGSELIGIPDGLFRRSREKGQQTIVSFIGLVQESWGEFNHAWNTSTSKTQHSP